MKITKYEHACVVVEDKGQLLVIDPGVYSKSFQVSGNIAGVVVTHFHSDHFDPEVLSKIKQQNPDVQIYSVGQVASEVPDLSVRVVKAGDSLKAGPFELKFYGGQHELFADTENIAVLVNSTLLHPGDSYTKPEVPVKVLAAPASAPWLRVTEATEYIKDIKASKVFPIHNALLSEIGESIHYRILSEAAQSVGSEWQVLKPGESLEI